MLLFLCPTKRVIVVCFEMFYNLDVSKTYTISYRKNELHFPKENCSRKMQRFAF